MKGPNKKDKLVEAPSWAVYITGCQLCKSMIINPRQKGEHSWVPECSSTTVHEAPHWKPPKYPSRTKQIHRLWRSHGGGRGRGGGRSTVQCRCPRGFHIPSLLGGQDSGSQGPPPGPQTYGKPPTLRGWRDLGGWPAEGWPARPCYSELDPTQPREQLLSARNSNNDQNS